MEEHKENYCLYMVTNINSEFPDYRVYTYEDIKQMNLLPTNYRVVI